MGRSVFCTFAGAATGFLIAVVTVQAITGPSPARDTAAITLFVGAFLAGTGAIAGAIVGSVAVRYDETIDRGTGHAGQ